MPMYGQSSLDPFHVSIGVMMVKNQNIPDHAQLNLQQLRRHQHQSLQHQNQRRLPQLLPQQRKPRLVQINAMTHILHVLVAVNQTILFASQNVEELISTVSITANKFLTERLRFNAYTIFPEEMNFNFSGESDIATLKLL